MNWDSDVWTETLCVLLFVLAFQLVKLTFPKGFHSGGIKNNIITGKMSESTAVFLLVNMGI